MYFDSIYTFRNKLFLKKKHSIFVGTLLKNNTRVKDETSNFSENLPEIKEFRREEAKKLKLPTVVISSDNICLSFIREGTHQMNLIICKTYILDEAAAPSTSLVPEKTKNSCLKKIHTFHCTIRTHHFNCYVLIVIQVLSCNRKKYRSVILSTFFLI